MVITICPGYPFLPITENPSFLNRQTPVSHRGIPFSPPSPPAQPAPRTRRSRDCRLQWQSNQFCSPHKNDIHNFSVSLSKFHQNLSQKIQSFYPRKPALHTALPSHFRHRLWPVSYTHLTLKTIWSYYDKNSLIELAKRHAISGCSALKKDELITKLSDAILEPEIMTTYLLCARDAEIRLFEGVLNGEHFVPYYEAEDLDYLYAGGYITEEENANHYYAAIEVKEAYDRINTESFRIRRKRLSVIGDYRCV